MGKNNDAGAFIVGALVGGLVGAATALLLAPQSGEETREQIHQKSLELQGKAEEALGQARSQVEAVVTDLQRRSEEIQRQGQVAFEEGQKQLTKALEETRKAAAASTAKEPQEAA